MTAVSLDDIEDALIARLQKGLGMLSLSVTSYSGELDELLAEVVRSFPAVWVTFGGISRTERVATDRHKVKAHGQWVVMIACRNVRNRSAGRRGGCGEVGAYQLVRAVRRLLQQQDLGLPIDYLQPGRVRTLYNTRVGGEPITAMACEFSSAWMEKALDNGAWPIDGCPDDAVFMGNRGQKDVEPHDLLRIGIDYSNQPGDDVADASDLVDLKRS